MKKNRLLIIVLLILSFTMLFLFPLTIIASEQDLIKESLTYLEKQDYRSAENLLEEALSLIWKKSPLELNNLIFCDEEPEGFGLYQKRADHNFVEGETFYLYAEPKYYSIVEIGENLFEIHFKVDLYILDMDNNILWGQRDYAENHFILHSPNKEMFNYFTITQETPFPKGEYQFLLVLKDVASQKTVEQ
ncbi:MAG: hypothetical protein WAW45_05140, partial [Atribacterota bacterium]